jgi:hypothetical protein
VDADAGLFGERRRQLVFRGRVDVAKFDHID